MVKIRSGSVQIRILILIFIYIFSLICVLSPTVHTSPDDETRSPTSNSGYWNDPTDAYSSNNDYASAFIRNQIHEWGDYGFSLSDVDIDEVLIGVEHYVSSSAYSIQVSVYDGSEWTQWSDTYTYTTETMLWLDYTDKVEWTPEKVNAIKTKLIYRVSGGGGCYPNNMYFVVIENTSLLEKELLEITSWEFYNPKQIQEALSQNRTLYVLSWKEGKGWFIDEDSEIIKVEVHDEGNYTLYDMYSGEMEITFLDEDDKNKTIIWESHIELTSNHDVVCSFDGENWFLETAENVYGHWNTGETVYVNHLWYNYTLKPFPVTDVKITKKFKDKVYNVLTKGDTGAPGDVPNQYKKGKTLSDQEYDMLMHLKKCGVPIGQFPPFLSITAKVPYTAYLDWIPVKVTYSTPEEEEGWVDCQYVGVNNTIAGEPTLFSSEWSDINASEGLSHFMFSTNNTGPWVNDTWSSSWRDTVWAEAEKTLNSTEDLTIAFRFYINNTEGTVYEGTICYFTTPVTRVYEGPFFGVTHRVDYGLTLLIVSPPDRNPSFLEFLYDKVEIPVDLIILNREDRARYFDLSYTVLSESGELLKEGDLSLEIEAKAQQPVSFSFQVPYGKREAPKNFSVSLQANGGKDLIDLELTLSHSAISFIYPLAFIGAIGLIIGVGYVIVKKTKREK